ncbi:magnesium transporter [Silvibacterium dinghuense]|uniref:Magnesium transporter n=2 Tax=Silvibacterium dinghuense TaxID=1560006 RepID=A0A4Q1SK69_9BACT|nr:magnesium transporter [Silvibacterium dinghuense]
MQERQPMITLTSLIGTPVTDAQGQLRGRVADLAVGTGDEAGRVMGLVLKARGGRALVPATDVRQTPSGALELRPEASPRPLADFENYILLRGDLLDRQIIDVHGRKVVRVNDVDLQWFDPATQAPSAGNLTATWDLRVREVEVGMRGAVRRLLQGLLPRPGIDSIASRFSPRVIPWDFVDMIEVDPARRVKLKIEHERLAQLHPSDIADILEELAPAEREAILMTLDEEVAAEALEEVEPKLQVSMVESLDSETAAAIVEEMDPSAAADLLAELPEERSEAILEEMHPEERQEVEELLEFREDSAAGRMTTEYVAVPVTASVGEAIQALREFEGDVETITEVYLVDADEVLKGVVSLARMVLAQPDTRLDVLTEIHFHTCPADAHENEVAELFDRYNLRALPVIDSKGRLAGVIEADHVIAFLRADR